MNHKVRGREALNILSRECMPVLSALLGLWKITQTQNAYRVTRPWNARHKHQSRTSQLQLELHGQKSEREPGCMEENKHELHSNFTLSTKDGQPFNPHSSPVKFPHPQYCVDCKQQ